jgi:hypothetical protein
MESNVCFGSFGSLGSPSTNATFSTPLSFSFAASFRSAGSSMSSHTSLPLGPDSLGYVSRVIRRVTLADIGDHGRLLQRHGPVDFGDELAEFFGWIARLCARD